MTSSGLRWSEEYLRAHQHAHQIRREKAQERTKQQNQAKVRKVKKNAVEAQTVRNEAYAENLALSCDIAACPPSVNHYWERSGRGMKLSDKAKDFHAIFVALVPALRLTSRLKLEVTFHFPTHQRRDIDNHLKATIDSLVKCGFCEDDEQFDELIVKRGAVVPGGMISLKVWEL